MSLLSFSGDTTAEIVGGFSVVIALLVPWKLIKRAFEFAMAAFGTSLKMHGKRSVQILLQPKGSCTTLKPCARPVQLWIVRASSPFPRPLWSREDGF
jgi:hypothetical protein